MRALRESSDCRKVFSNLMIRLTPDNSNPRYLEPKSISPGFPSYIYCKFTLDNSNLPLTRSSFCFPSEHLYKILPLITRTMFEPLKVGKKQSTGVLNIDLNFPLTCCRHIAVMHQSIPAAPSAPPPPGLLRGICPPCQSRGWGISKFCTVRWPGIYQPRGHSRVFDTHAVSYQNITTQKVLLEKRRLAHLSRTGIN